MVKPTPKSHQSRPVIRQRQPSIYMAIGAFFSAIWFFALPPLEKITWESLWGDLDPTLAEAIMWATTLPFFLLYCIAVALPVYYLRSPFLEQFKISRDEWPWLSDDDRVRANFRRLTMKSIAYDILTFGLYLPVLAYLKATMLPSRTMSFSLEDWPTYWELARDNLCLAILNDFLYYWTHRMMHSFPILYQYHKVHHEYKQNTVVATQYLHPIDFLLTVGIPSVITTAVVKPHAYTSHHFGTWLLVASFDDHLGYAFPWTPIRWFPFSSGTDAHEFHHSVNRGCYGSKLSLWDWVFGTDEVYNEWHKKRWGVGVVD